MYDSATVTKVTCSFVVSKSWRIVLRAHEEDLIGIIPLAPKIEGKDAKSEFPYQTALWSDGKGVDLWPVVDKKPKGRGRYLARKWDDEQQGWTGVYRLTLGDDDSPRKKKPGWVKPPNEFVGNLCKQGGKIWAEFANPIAILYQRPTRTQLDATPPTVEHKPVPQLSEYDRGYQAALAELKTSIDVKSRK